jgi:hypothetical protein
MKKLIKLIEKINFDPDYNTLNNCVLIREKKGAYLIEFYLHYEQIIKNYIGSDYFSPEEYNITFEPKKISDLTIYINNEILELNDKKYESLKNLIEFKILHQ